MTSRQCDLQKRNVDEKARNRYWPQAIIDPAPGTALGRFRHLQAIIKRCGRNHITRRSANGDTGGDGKSKGPLFGRIIAALVILVTVITRQSQSL